MTSHALLDRQVSKATDPSGQLDVHALMQLVADAYEEKEQDRRRSDRASNLMAEELSEALHEIELQNVRFKAALDNLMQGLCLFDHDGQLTVCNRRFLEIYGIADERDVLGKSRDEVLAASTVLQGADALEQRLLIGEHAGLSISEACGLEQLWPDGRSIAITRRPVPDGGFLDTISDVTDVRMAHARIAHLARHDALTDLPNRVLLRERLLEVSRESKRGGKAAVICIDLDRFKAVNDTLGHPIGDALLIAVSARLTAMTRSTDIVARLGGDEFALILRRIGNSEEALKFGSRIVQELSRPFELDGHHVQIGASVGIEIVDGNDSDPDDAIRNADLALYKAKADGRGKVRLFEPALYMLATKRRQLEIDLRAAFDADQFEVYYQPQIDLADQKISSFEALVRWHHPEKGLVSPDKFIPVLEDTGLIDQLGALVLNRACVDAMSWPSNIRVAVNLSPIQFKSGKLPKMVADALERSGFAPERLELEITESVMLDDSGSVLAQLHQLKRKGIHVALDDFGTGYSSLSHIRNFAFNRIKIDQSFVKELGNSPDSLAIIRAVSGLCSSLGIDATAEGVETVAQLEILLREKCSCVQGFLFGRPVPLALTHDLIAQRA